MSWIESTEILGDWEGYDHGTVGRIAGRGRQDPEEAWIELVPDATSTRYCSGCGEAVESIHDTQERWVRDLPILGAQTWLLVHRCRMACPRCGPRTEALEWLPLHARVTRRLADCVAELCKVLPIKHVAKFYGLSWTAVKRIDKAYLKKKLEPVDLRGLEVLAMDEFAIQRGHRYATVVLDPRNKRVLWVGRGRTREAVRPFFELLGRERCLRIRAVAMDMNSAFELEVADHCPNAEVVFDLFHVVAKFGREVVDRVRIDEANRVSKSKKDRKVIKSARWLMLRNRENLTTDGRVRLGELLKANKKLMTVYVLKDDLKHLWDFRYAGAAERFWKGWYSRAMRSRIEPLKRFAKRLKGYLPGIISHCRWPLHTSLLEGINNKIKVIKRMAYGFRDDEYFFLKIRSAFPGNRR